MVTTTASGPAETILSAVFCSLVAVIGLAVRRTRLVTAVFLVLPVALAIALDTAGKEVFKLNIFSTISAPFVILVVAMLSQRLRPGLRALAVFLCAALFVLGSVEFLDGRVPTTGFLKTAELIRADGRPGDVVYAPQQSTFWAMARYLVGPDWGSALAVAAAPDQQWRRLYDRLGPRLVNTLRLEPQTQSLAAPDGLTLLVGGGSLAQAASGKRVWLITYARADLPKDFPPAAIGALKPQAPRTINFLTVTLYE